MRLYHRTTYRKLKHILKFGLKKSSLLTNDSSVAYEFARVRSGVKDGCYLIYDSNGNSIKKCYGNYIEINLNGG